MVDVLSTPVVVVFEYVVSVVIVFTVVLVAVALVII